MAAILKSAILDSDTAILESNTLLSSLRFTQKHSHSTLTLTQTNSIWLMWWWQPSWILPSWIQPVWRKKNFIHLFWLNFIMAAILNSTILDSAILHKNTSLIHSESTWWLQPSWILPLWIQPLSSWIQTPCYLLSDSLKNTLTPPWLKLIQSDSNSFILTLTWRCQPSWILPSWIQPFWTNK